MEVGVRALIEVKAMLPLPATPSRPQKRTAA
jgi:hypothetical protein